MFLATCLPVLIQDNHIQVQFSTFQLQQKRLNFFKNNYKKLRLKKFTNKVHDKFNLDVKLVETWCSVVVQFEFVDSSRDETFDFC